MKAKNLVGGRVVHKKLPILEKMGEAAFGVYIFHAAVWPVFSWIFLKHIMPHIGGIGYEELEFETCGDQGVVSSKNFRTAPPPGGFSV